jgi:GNAT superfamily N-acetyltransferase
VTDEELIAGCDGNYYAAWRLVTSGTGSGFLHEEDGILIAAPDTPIAWLNIVFVTQPLPDPEAALSRASSLLEARELPYLVRIREGLDAEAESAAQQLGMEYTDTIPGMTLMPLPDAPAVTLEIRDADGSSFGAFADIIAESFEIDREVAKRMLNDRLLEPPNARWFIGYADGEAAATSALITTDRVAGIHFVGTSARFRRRGFGEAMTRYAASEGAAAGCAFAALQASEMGYPIYQRMGFRHITGYKTFVHPRYRS